MTKFDLKEVAELLKQEMWNVCDEQVDTFQEETLVLSDKQAEIEYDGWTFSVIFDAYLDLEENYREDEYGRRYYSYASISNASSFYVNDIYILDKDDNEVTEYTDELKNLLEK